jgi:hypothetical protein
MNTARTLVVMALVGSLALSGASVSFGQCVLIPAAPALPPDSQPAPAPGSLPQGPQPLPTAPAQPLPAAPVQPLPAAPVQPLPTAPVQPFPAAPVQPVPTGSVPPVGAQPVPVPGVQSVPVPGVPNLNLIRGSHIIGSTAFLLGGVPIGTVQDLLSVAGSGEYVLIANPSGFVAIPRSLTIFDPVSRILQVNMTFAQCGQLPRLLQLAQLNREFLERVHRFFHSPHGQSILKNGVARNARPTHPAGGTQNRGETRTASKPATGQQTRTEPHSARGPDLHR